MDLKINDVFPYQFEPGTYISFEDNTFYAVIADEAWSDLELKLFRKGKGRIQFVDKNDLCIFLVTINDVIETSDFYFNPMDEEDFKISDSYQFLLLLLDKNSVIRQMKKTDLSAEFIHKFNQTVQRIHSFVYDEQDYEQRISRIQSQYEPFELEPFICAEQKI